MRERACMHEGTCYPTNHVTAAFDGQQDAEDAGAALRGAGFADIGLFHGREAYVAIQDASKHIAAVTRVWRRLRDLGEDQPHEYYLAILRRGGSYLIVRADTPEQAAQARDLLASHHAHDIWYLGAWTLERLPERQLPERQPVAGSA